MNWLIAVSVVVLLGASVVTLRATERTTRPVSAARMGDEAGRADRATAANAAASAAAGNPAVAAGDEPALSTGSVKQHPPASAPEESATIKDDPTTAPDPSQSADNNVSFPTDI